LILAAFGPTKLSLIEYISVGVVTAAYGFALTARHFFQTPSVSGYLSPLLIDSFIQEGEGV
jgi:hypothetical protein